MTNPLPAEAFSVGEHLADELEARGWSAEELARRAGWPVEYVNGLLAPDSRAHFGFGQAHRLGRVFGTSTELWLNLYERYRTWKAAQP